MRILSFTLLILLASAAAATARVPIERSKELWATVNVCDSPAKPDQIGIRGSMPGWPRKARKQMRFQVQYKVGEQWKPVREGGDSDWISLGQTPRRTVEAGQNFLFTPPEGGTLTLRGQVTFRWRRNGKTIKRVRELTERGHKSTRDADPPDFSAAECQIS